ncbi:MAG: hypothetical protein DMD86_12890, partial [Candidatus Rokuibacteriota bacterium]
MRRAALATAAAAALAWPLVAPKYFVFLATLVAVNAVVAIGLNLLSGYTNQLSFGHAGFLAVGAYVAALLTLRFPALPVPLTLLLAGLATGLVGLALGIPCLRLEGLYLAMATLAFGFVVTEAIMNLDWLTRGNDGLRVPAGRVGPWALDTDAARWYLALAVTALMVVAALNIAATRTGRAFLAIRTSEIAAKASGINVAAYKAIAFALSAFYTGVAGEVGFEGGEEGLAVLVVLVERAEPPELPLADQVLDHHARLAVAQREPAEDVLAVARLRRALEGEEHRHLVLLEVAERRHHGRRALGRDDREDLVLFHELPGVGDGVLRPVAIVIVGRADLAPVNAAGVVDDLEVEIHPVPGRLLARERERARERVRAAEQDLRVRHALIRRRRRRAEGGP